MERSTNALAELAKWLECDIRMIEFGNVAQLKRFRIDPFTGETLEDFGFKEDCVVMTQNEYETLKKKSEVRK